MLILVYGSDTFRARQKVSELKERFQEKFDPSGLNLFELSSRPALGELMAAAQAAPFLGVKRMVIVRDFLAAVKKDEPPALTTTMGRIPESTILLFWDEVEAEKMEKSEGFKAIQGLPDVHSYPFSPLSGAALRRWVAAHAMGLGMALTRGAADELARRVGSNLWRTHQEMEKLRAFSLGAAVDEALVRQTVAATFEERMFDFLDAVSRREARTAVEFLRQERSSGTAEPQIFTMLVRQVRILLGARAMLDDNPRATKQELAAALALHPFVAQKALAQTRAFSLTQLRLAHQVMFNFDLKIKTGRMDPGLAVELAMTHLTGNFVLT